MLIGAERTPASSKTATHDIASPRPVLRPLVQGKIAVERTNDPCERNADEVADSTVRRLPAGWRATSELDTGVSVSAAPSRIQRVQRSGRSSDGFAAPAEIESGIEAARSNGTPLEPKVRSRFEGAMGVDLGRVRVHHDSSSDRLSRAISAKAFTTQRDVFFSQGTYAPNTADGQRLLAHELAHTVQQSGPVQRSMADSRMVRREPTDDRGTSWKAIDQAATEKRLAHAKDEYLFDKSLVAGEEATNATGQRLDEQRGTVATENDVGILSPVFLFLYTKNPDLAISQFGYNPTQAATIRARLKETKSIPRPDELLPPSAIEAHLGKFAQGAHAFIDPTASKKIEGEITDTRFKGWGIDANFVAPLDEANALNAKAHKERGIETIEDELGIPSKYWSKSEWNPAKELVRWVIPKPKVNVAADTVGVLLEMATGQETGADPKLWVAGGLTKGGASEAVLKAIPREQLIKFLADGQIRQKIEKYPETRDGIA